MRTNKKSNAKKKVSAPLPPPNYQRSTHNVSCLLDFILLDVE